MNDDGDGEITNKKCAGDKKERGYDDIIDYAYSGVKYHPRMSLRERAAQFAPFAALTGFDEAIKRAEREYENETR